MDPSATPPRELLQGGSAADPDELAFAEFLAAAPAEGDPETGAAQVFERPMPRAARLAFSAAAWLGYVGPPLVLLFFARPIAMAFHSGVLRVLGESWPLGRLPLLGTLAAAVGACWFLPTLAAVWARGRYGRCELHATHAVFDVVLSPGRRRVLREQVLEWSVLPRGVTLRVRGRSRWLELYLPLLVPATSSAEREQVLAWLTGGAPDG